MLLAGLGITLWAWCLLSLGLPRHHQAVLRQPLTHVRRRGLRMGGWGLSLAGFAWFVGWKGWELGPIFWVAALILTALVWVLLLALLTRGRMA